MSKVTFTVVEDDDDDRYFSVFEVEGIYDRTDERTVVTAILNAASAYFRDNPNAFGFDHPINLGDLVDFAEDMSGYLEEHGIHAFRWVAGGPAIPYWRTTLADDEIWPGGRPQPGEEAA